VMPRGPLRLRYEPDTKELWVPAAALRELFVSRQIDLKTVIPELAIAGMFKNGGKALPKRISTGAMGSFEAASIRCYCIDGSIVGIDEETLTGAKADS